jgi:TIR domain
MSTELFDIWGAMDRQVFISHSSHDERIAAEICDRFEKAGMRCWMASRDALPGQHFARSIVAAIDDSRLMLVVLSKDANESDHVINEINRAVNQHVPILPVKADGSALSDMLDYYLGKTLSCFRTRPAALARAQSLLLGHLAGAP